MMVCLWRSLSRAHSDSYQADDLAGNAVHVQQSAHWFVHTKSASHTRHTWFLSAKVPVQSNSWRHARCAGRIPTEVVQLRRLSRLDLGENKLDGAL